MTLVPRSARLLATIALVAIAVSGCSLGAATSRPSPSVSQTGSPNAQETDYHDITYCNSGGGEVMDIFVPPGNGGPMPAVVHVHGGGWTSGDNGLDPSTGVVRQMLDKGIVIATINYRLAPQYRWPAQIIDAKCAVRYLRANADKYRIDPSHIGAVGESAGAQMASLLGIAGKDAGFDEGEYGDKSSAVQSVVDIAGPADLTAGDWPQYTANLIYAAFGAPAGYVSNELRKGSPVTYVSAGNPPFLVIQGDKDTIVPPTQAQDFARKLQSAGVDATLVVVMNADHNLSPVGGTISPTQDQLNQDIVDFFARTLAR